MFDKKIWDKACEDINNMTEEEKEKVVNNYNYKKQREQEKDYGRYEVLSNPLFLLKCLVSHMIDKSVSAIRDCDLEDNFTFQVSHPQKPTIFIKKKDITTLIKKLLEIGDDKARLFAIKNNENDNRNLLLTVNNVDVLIQKEKDNGGKKYGIFLLDKNNKLKTDASFGVSGIYDQKIININDFEKEENKKYFTVIKGITFNDKEKYFAFEGHRIFSSVIKEIAEEEKENFVTSNPLISKQMYIDFVNQHREYMKTFKLKEIEANIIMKVREEKRVVCSFVSRDYID